MQEIQKTEKPSVLDTLAARYQTTAGQLVKVIKETLIKSGNNGREVTNEHLQAFCIVANEYQLNPFTKQIYAFPDKSGGIVPVVGVDGWIALMQRHPQYNGVTYKEADDGSWCECSIYRKDQPQPTVIREYMSECRREPVNGKPTPWQTHPHRMLRHKALIQCARVAFGLSGIYDRDEAERIAEANSMRDVTPKKPVFNELDALPAARPLDSLLNEVEAENRKGAYHD